MAGRELFRFAGMPGSGAVRDHDPSPLDFLALAGLRGFPLTVSRR
ncbi:hypothetical protein FRAHR75_420047 [Frankia sp. Hr75.2]|nr:hypothetical protein FRAHR75_420047 [Frankia sp. Hr75.2]